MLAGFNDSALIGCIYWDMTPTITFVIQYSDQAGKISKLVKNFYEDIRSKYFCGYFTKYNLVTAFKRNKNKKDYLVHAKLWTILYITEPVPTLFFMQKNVFSPKIDSD